MQSQLVALTLVVIFLVGTVLAVPYNNYDDQLLDEYKQRLENYLMSADKRSCIRRGGNLRWPTQRLLQPSLGKK
ncbi:hypothetical protein MRX96_040259 [Rhipicephalus microplus]